MSLTDKIIAVVAVVLAVLALNAVVILRVVSDAKAHEDAAVQKVSIAAEIGAQKITDNWKAQYDQADATHKQELADTVSAISFVPISVQKYPLLSVVSPSTGTTFANPSPAAGSEVCAGLLQSSSDELQTEFDNATSADQLIADYRDLYTSWPQTSTSSSARNSAPSK